ncbi:hypothetical protein D5086_008906 [Populus alba]|uniref:Uncharacterized protein n=1 Tax=Populus alba TaxID=43335 RepID=A0ACC4CGR4_POPAL
MRTNSQQEAVALPANEFKVDSFISQLHLNFKIIKRKLLNENLRQYLFQNLTFAGKVWQTQVLNNDMFGKNINASLILKNLPL